MSEKAIVTYVGGHPADARMTVPLGRLDPVRRVPTPESEARARAKRKKRTAARRR